MRTGGILDQVLDKLAIQREKDAQIISKIKGALTYPAVVTTATIAAFFFLMTVIVPGVANILSLNAQLPPYTIALLATSHFMVHSWYVMIPAFIAIGVAYYRWHKTDSGKHTIDKIMLKMPIFGPILVKVNVARFARTFGSLMASGISVSRRN